MQDMPQSDFAVVGAGLTGLAIAYGLARLGRSVVILERRDKPQLLNQPSHGLLWAQANLGAEPIQREWNLLALSKWCEFDEQLCQISASATHYERAGGLWLADDPLALQGRRLQAEAGSPGDPELEWLDGETLQRLIPRLSAEIVGASYCPDDGQLNLQLLHRALVRALDNLNVEQRYLSTVERVVSDGDAYLVKGEGFTLCTRQLVLANGGQSEVLVQSLGFEPLQTVVDTFWETSQVRQFLPFPAWQLRQARDGSLLVPVGEFGAESEGWRLALKAYPNLRQLSVRRRWQNVRTECESERPLYQRSTQYKGVFRVVSPDSLLHCPLHASLVPAWLVGKLADQAMAPFFGEITAKTPEPCPETAKTPEPSPSAPVFGAKSQ
ncbi:MAG: NAD(P)/FAD-dependent oxidoreductase [Granulosicoccaceae bacterium]